MILKLYIDTSIIGGYFDPEFDEYTKPLFKRIKNKEFNVIYSSLTEEDLVRAPDEVKYLIRSLPIDIRSPRELMNYEDY